MRTTFLGYPMHKRKMHTAIRIGKSDYMFSPAEISRARRRHARADRKKRR